MKPLSSSCTCPLSPLSFFKFEDSFWTERHRANVLLVHYNDLIADLDGEMHRIADRLGIGERTLWTKLKKHGI